MARRYAILSCTALALALALGSAAALAQKDDGAPTDRQSNALYWEGQAALKDSDWSKALKLFEELEKLLRKNEPQSADAALYWQAYALAQSKRTAEARGVIERMHRQFPESRWNKDADALLAQTQPPSQASAGTDDDDLADVAVQALLNAPPERALPLLQKVLSSSRPVATKKRALFVLSQLGTSAALDAIIDTAKHSSEPALRDEAIRMLGVSGDAAATERLREIYTSSQNPDEKRRIIEAWLIADRKDLILAAAQNDSDESVRRKAIQTLGALGASDELARLFDTTKDPGNRREIIQSLGVAGSSGALVGIAGNIQLPEEDRVAAMHALGIAGDRGGERALVDLYAKADTPALRDAVLQGLLIAGDTDAVMQLYKAAQSTDEKKALLRLLTQMDGDAAIDIIEDELNRPEGQ